MLDKSLSKLWRVTLLGDCQVQGRKPGGEPRGQCRIIDLALDSLVWCCASSGKSHNCSEPQAFPAILTLCAHLSASEGQLADSSMLTPVAAQCLRGPLPLRKESRFRAKSSSKIFLSY